LFCLNTFANDKNFYETYYSFKHENCVASVKTLSKEASFLKSTLESKLKERNFKVRYIDKERIIRKRDLYIMIKHNRIDGKSYKDCEVEIKLKQAKNDYRMSSSDKILNQKKVKRSFPRITFKGNERCKRALKDTFTDIPFCKKPD
jgi:hypothetical protein